MPASATLKATPEAQLRSYVARFDDDDQKLIRSIRSALRKRLPTANELAYDYGHSVVISYSPTERGIEAVVAFSACAGDMRLYFNAGPKLPDPKKLLLGTGRQTRYIRVASARRLAEPDVEALIVAAIDHAVVPLADAGRGQLMMKGGAAKKRRR